MGDEVDPLAAALAEADAAVADIQPMQQEPINAESQEPLDELKFVKGEEVTVLSAHSPPPRIQVSGYNVYLNDENRLNVPATLGPQTVLVDGNGIIVPLGPTGYTDLPLVPGLEYHARNLKSLKDEMEKDKGDEPITESIWNIFTGESNDENAEEKEEEPKEEPAVVALSWKKLEPTGQIPLPRYNHTSTLIGDTMYVFGGQVEGSTSNLLFTMSLTNKIWTRVETSGTVPAPRYGHVCIAHGKNLILCGGVVRKAPTADIFILDTETMVWSKPAVTGDVPCGRYGHSATLKGDNIFVFAGINAEDEYLSDLYSFDILTNQWVCPDVGGAVPEGVAWHVAALVGERIVVYGGKRRMFMFVDEYIEDVFIYNIPTSEWLGPVEYFDADTVSGRAQLSCVAISDTQLLFYGGETRWGDDISVIILDLSKKMWIKAVIGGQWPEARHGHSAIVYGSEMLIFGGLAEGWTVGNVYSLSFLPLGTPHMSPTLTLTVSNDHNLADNLGAQALPSVETADTGDAAAGTVVVAQKMEERQVEE